MRSVLAVGVALAVLALSGAASADSITINDLTDTVSITDGTGGRVTSACSGETCSFTVTGPQGTDQISFEGTPIFNLLEPNISPPTVSDTLACTGSIDTASCQFNSDTETALSPLTNGRTLTEDGTAQPTIVIDYFDSTDDFISSDTIFAQSDKIESVPEPGTFLLLGVGLAGMGGLKARRRT